MVLSKEQIRFSIWLGITFFSWWLGIGPSDFFILPALFCVVEIILWILRDRFFLNLNLFSQQILVLLSRKRIRFWLIGFLILQASIWFLVVILRYYSFHLWTWDAGLHSNILFNISQGEFYSSFLKVNSLGDHFTPTFGLIALFYKITPSIHWMMAAKLLAFGLTPIIFYRLILFELKDPLLAKISALVISIGWFMLYAPIVNAMRYEFQASSLAPPFIALLYLMMQKKRWIWFCVLAILLLGIKEHMGAVLIGFGIHRYLKKENTTGSIIMFVVGILSIYIILFQVMPYFRDYQASWSGVERIAPFKDLLLKLSYLFKLVLPFGFIPLLFWRNGIMAGPAIGINLISGMPTMYSAHYHYDDVSGTLLFIAMIVSIKDLEANKIFSKFPRGKIIQIFILIIFMAFLAFLPRSAPRYLIESWPKTAHFELESELKKFEKNHKIQNLMVQDVLGPHLLRRNIEVLRQKNDQSCDRDFSKRDLPVDYILLSNLVSPYQIDDLPQCILQLESSKIYTKLEGYQHLIIFKRIKG